MRRPLTLVAPLLLMLAMTAVRSTAQGAPPTAPALDTLIGQWQLNPELSDKPGSLPDGTDRGRGRGGGRGRSDGGPGGGRRGGFGGGGFGRGGSGAGSRAPDEGRMRQMATLRDLLEAPDRLTITATETMVIVTAGDGRTTRLLPDGSAVKDESTKSERRTRWSGGALTSEISGLGRGKITETYLADHEPHRLTVTVHLENSPGADSQKGRTLTRVYDAEAQ